jgi:hypothetical protein
LPYELYDKISIGSCVRKEGLTAVKLYWSYTNKYGKTFPLGLG